MSPLRQKFVSFLELRGFQPATVRNYVQAVKQYQDWLGKSPMHMTTESVREYLYFLKKKKRLAARTINIHLYALKAFREFFIPDPTMMEPFRRLKTPKRQALTLSVDEIKRLIESAPNLKGKTMIATMYSSGIRIDECLNLHVCDIDSKRMVLHIANGKGARE